MKTILTGLLIVLFLLPTCREGFAQAEGAAMLHAGLAGKGTDSGRAVQPEMAVPGKTHLAAMLQPPSDGITRVQVGVQLIQVEEIHETTESYTLKVFLDLRWNDPRLAFDEDQSGAKLVFNEEHAAEMRHDIWWPDLEIRNERHPPEVENQELIIYADGSVEYEEIIDVDLTTHMNLRKFPFDTQVFVLELESFAYDSTQVEFVVNEHVEPLDEEFFVDGWEMLGVQAESRLVHETRSDKQFSVVDVKFTMKRDGGYYVWRFFLPLFMFLLMAWMMFWMSDSLDTRGNVSLFALMIVIFYHGFLASELPKVSYLSIMDLVIIACYLLLGAAVLLETYRSKLQEAGNEARRAALNRFSRKFFPAVTVGGWLLLLVVSWL